MTTEETPADQQTGVTDKARTKKFKHAVETTKQYRRKLVHSWQLSVDYRRGKPFASQSDEDRVSVPLDWALTKQKESQLFSQVPAVRVNHPPNTIADDALPWVHPFETRLNDTIITAGIESAMNEIIPDCINAAGIGVAIVAREAITETVNIPAVDLSMLPPEVLQQVTASGIMPDGTEVPMIPTPRVIDSRYTVSRISPADFLWPLGFTGSDFDQAPWVGRSGRASWAEAKRRFTGLTDEDKDSVVGHNKTSLDKIVQMDASDKGDEDEDIVSFDEIFFKSAYYDPEAKSFSAIHHMVFVEGKEDPVVDEPWQGQRQEETGVLVGSMKYPIRALTLAYITDEPIPPSDSAIGRPQVDEINKARTQMIRQRERSIPIRWFDVNRVDPAIQYGLMRGTWQGMIPVQGIGTNVIGEIARAGMGQENFMFDRIAKNDLNESWQVGMGMWGQDVETKAEVQAVGAGMDIRVARERAKVGKFFVGISEVLGGLVSIFEDPASFGEGFTPVISRALAYSILADSTVLLDSNQRLKKLMDFINFTAKSGWVDIAPVLREIATLSGLDPAVVIKPPKPKDPVEPNMSFRMTGTEDMMNPLMLAFMIKTGQAPDEALIEQAKKLIAASVTPPPVPPMEGMGPMGPEGPQMPPLPMGPEGVPMPEPPPPGIGAANSGWSALDRVNQRVVDRDGEQ